MKRPERAGSGLTAGFWPTAHDAAAPFRLARRALGAATALGLLSGVLSGCGGATAPCRTSPATLDAHRSQSQALQEDLGQKSETVAELEAEREEADRRIQAAMAQEDSLRRASPPKRGRR